MTCGLSDEELFILNVLYSNRCMRANRGYNSRKLAHLFGYKYNNKYRDKIVKSLVNERYITTIKKKDIKYYISDVPRTFFAPGEHGYNVVKGRKRRL